MSIRLTILYLLIAGLVLHAWKDWFKSLCGLIVLMAVIEYPDMPHNILGMQGLNLWNVLFGIIVLAWARDRHRGGMPWDMPRHITMLLLLYLGVVLVGVLRAALDPGEYKEYPFGSLISEELINTVKWVLPAILLFDGCRSRRQVIMALACILAVYFLIAIQVIKWIPPESALGGDDEYIQIRRLKLGQEIGYHTTDVSVMLAGACWGMMATLALIRKKTTRMAVLAAAGVIAYGQALTGGRGGYVAWGATGLMLCILKWRKYLLLAPVVVLLLPILLPGATARMLAGFGQTDASGQAAVNEEAATSGRTMIWPYVIAEIRESPWIGYGRLAMKRTGLSRRVGEETGDDTWPHPHNMYLETLLDNGILGSLPICAFWGMVLIHSGKLFQSSNRLYSVVGGFSCAMAFSSLFAGISGQHVYPQEHTMCLWAALFLVLRVRVEEKRVLDTMGGPGDPAGKMDAVCFSVYGI